MTEGVSSFGVVGAGIMGRGIAEVAAVAGGFQKVIIFDTVEGQLEAALATIGKDLSRLVEKGKLEEAGKARTLGLIRPTTDLAELAECDFVVEAAPEDLEIKKGVFKRLDGLLGPEACLASNTSSIPITRLASATGRPERVIGMHFMNPVPRMKGLEIIKGLCTSPETCRLTLDLASRFGKQTTFSKDRAGFVINRVLIPMLNDAFRGLDAGLSTVESVDRYFKEGPDGPRHPMGPFMLTDLIGLDTTLHILEVLAGELGPQYAPAPLLAGMVGAGICGQKSGEGFYTWERGRPPKVNPRVAGLQESAPAGDAAANAPELGRRAWLGMMNEAVRVIEEGTSTVADVDRGCLYCLNHPEGILAALDRFGIGKACTALEELEKRFGSGCQPAPLLRRLSEAGLDGAASGRGIYTWDPAAGEIAGANPVLEEYLA